MIGQILLIKLYPFDQNDWKYNHCEELNLYAFATF